MKGSLRILQHNCARSGDVLHNLCETGKERKADILLIQEPPTNTKYRPSHPAYHLTWAAKTAIGVRVDTGWRAQVMEEITKESEGYIQVVDLQ